MYSLCNIKNVFIWGLRRRATLLFCIVLTGDLFGKSHAPVPVIPEDKIGVLMLFCLSVWLSVHLMWQNLNIAHYWQPSLIWLFHTCFFMGTIDISLSLSLSLSLSPSLSPPPSLSLSLSLSLSVCVCVCVCVCVYLSQFH